MVVSATAAILVFGALWGCAPAVATRPAIAPGTTGVVELDERPFALYVGQGYRTDAPTTLVVSLHGYTADAQSGFGFFGLRTVADQRGLLVALPEGTTDRGGDRFWNASRACCDFWGTGVDDSGYLSRVIAEVSAQYAVEPGAVVVIGHSNGGFMAHRLACEHADQLAAVVSLAGALDVGGECHPSRPVSVLQVHGTADDTILFGGGRIEQTRYTSVEETLAGWRQRDGCPDGTGREGTALDLDSGIAGDDVTPVDWTECRGGTGVSLWPIEGGSHSPALSTEFGQAVLDWVQARR